MSNGRTFVANATAYTIWARCDSDRSIIVEASQKIENAYSRLSKQSNSYDNSGRGKIGVSGIVKFIGGVEMEAEGRSSGSNHNEYQNSNSSSNESAIKQQIVHVALSGGFTKIVTEEYLQFATTGPLVYVSIYIEAPSGFQEVATAHPIHAGRDVIIRWDGQLCMGTKGSNAFEDDRGNNLKTALREAKAKAKQSAPNRSESDGGADNWVQTRPIGDTIVKPATQSSLEHSNGSAGRRWLKSHHNTYLSGQEDGVKVSMASSRGHWEKWDVQCNGNGELWLKAQHRAGRFLRGYPDGRVDQADKLEGWEKWESYKHGDGGWSFKSAHGKWLSARADGSVCCVGKCGALERFTLENW